MAMLKAMFGIPGGIAGPAMPLTGAGWYAPLRCSPPSIASPHGALMLSIKKQLEWGSSAVAKEDVCTCAHLKTTHRRVAYALLLISSDASRDPWASDTQGSIIGQITF